MRKLGSRGNATLLQRVEEKIRWLASQNAPKGYQNFSAFFRRFELLVDFVSLQLAPLAQAPNPNPKHT